MYNAGNTLFQKENKCVNINDIRAVLGTRAVSDGLFAWQEAREVCEQYSGNLLMLKTMDQMRLIRYLHDTARYSNFAFFGLRSNITSTIPYYR